MYREALNADGEVKIGSLTFDPADIIEQMDPTAYRCGLVDFQDGLSREREYEEIDEEIYNAKEVQDIRDEIESELEEK